jgi:hypothetical protein
VRALLSRREGGHLIVLQKIVDARLIPPQETAHLQALGVVLGDRIKTPARMVRSLQGHHSISCRRRRASELQGRPLEIVEGQDAK